MHILQVVPCHFLPPGWLLSPLRLGWKFCQIILTERRQLALTWRSVQQCCQTCQVNLTISVTSFLWPSRAAVRFNYQYSQQSKGRYSHNCVTSDQTQPGATGVIESSQPENSSLNFTAEDDSSDAIQYNPLVIDGKHRPVLLQSTATTQTYPHHSRS